MNGKKQIARCWQYCLAAMVLQVCAGGVSMAGTNTLTFSTDIVQQACAITFSGPDVSGGATVTLPDIRSDAIDMRHAGSQMSEATLVTLTMDQCGMKSDATKPYITLSGGDVDSAASAGQNATLFRSATSTSSGYFVVASATQGAENLSDEMTVCGAGEVTPGCTLWNGDAGDSGQGKIAYLYLAATCVSADGCADATPGSLNAGLQFTFLYQ